MSFSLTVIGCGSATPVGHRLSSAFVLRHNQRFFLIDCGESTQMHLKDNHIHMQKISHILISHLHGDHYFGLVGLISSLHLFGRRNPLYVYGPPELEQIVRMQLEVGQTELSYPLRFVVTGRDSQQLLFEDKTMEVYSFPLVHGMHTTGFLFREKPSERGETPPKSFAYCSDTAYTETILPYVENVDVMYHESTFLESESRLAEERFHSTALQAARLARKAGVKHLLLGHYSARYATVQEFYDEAVSEFPDVRTAFEGMEWVF